MEIMLQLALLAFGFYLLGKGSDWFVDGAASIAARFGIPQLIIGLTIVAMGTSAPEAAVSITAAANGSADVSVGNVLGSNIMNIWVILGVAAAVTVLHVQTSTARVEIPFMIAITGLLYFLGRDGTIHFLDGVMLWLCFIAYLGYLYFVSRNSNMEADTVNTLSMQRSLLYLFIGMGAILLGSDCTVRAATKLALIMGMSERIIGLTIVALGTSLPELFTSVNAALKHEADIAIGNIVGSNVFNVLFVLGSSALLIPLPYAKAFMLDTYFALGAAISLWLLVLPKQKLVRASGLVMLCCYGYYFTTLL